MFKRLLPIFAVVLLTLAVFSTTAPATEELEGGITCRFDLGQHDEWGYWKPENTYIVLGWTWTGEDGHTGYSVTDSEGNQGGPLTLAEFQAHVAPYLAQPLPYGCPPSSSGAPTCQYTDARSCCLDACAHCPGSWSCPFSQDADGCVTCSCNCSP